MGPIWALESIWFFSFYSYTHGLRTTVSVCKGVLYGLVKESVNIRKLILYGFFSASLQMRIFKISCCESLNMDLGFIVHISFAFQAIENPYVMLWDIL